MTTVTAMPTSITQRLLQEASEMYRAAQNQRDECMDLLKQRIREAHAAGMTQTAITEIVPVTRTTVFLAIQEGKRSA